MSFDVLATVEPRASMHSVALCSCLQSMPVFVSMICTSNDNILLQRLETYSVDGNNLTGGLLHLFGADERSTRNEDSATDLLTAKILMR